MLVRRRRHTAGRTTLFGTGFSMKTARQFPLVASMASNAGSANRSANSGNRRLQTPSCPFPSQGVRQTVTVPWVGDGVRAKPRPCMRLDRASAGQEWAARLIPSQGATHSTSAPHQWPPLRARGLNMWGFLPTTLGVAAESPHQVDSISIPRAKAVGVQRPWSSGANWVGSFLRQWRRSFGSNRPAFQWLPSQRRNCAGLPRFQM
jgi:hypothetical protein